MERIRAIVARSEVPEDALHAENTLEWVLRLDPESGQAIQVAALAHDIDRAVGPTKVRRSDYADFDAFKAAHALQGAKILRAILEECGVAGPTIEEACRLVELHEVGGDRWSDLLRDADSISFFEVNLPLYYKREGWEETKRRCIWGYRRVSARAREIILALCYEDGTLTALIDESIRRVPQKDQEAF
ncbi:MAG: DUF4202 family protein [Deltaproteobacteria bacterium]|nr:DUF4202 family protein [Deltaproteobacteria bacterium]